MRKIFLLLCGLLLCGAAACGTDTNPSEPLAMEATPAEATLVQNHVSQRLSSGVIVDADTTEVKGVTSLPIYFAHPVLINYSKAKELLLSEKTIVMEDEQEVKGGILDSSLHSCRTEDGFFFSSSGADLYLMNETASKVSRIFNFVEMGTGATDTTGKNLDFQDLDHVKNEVEGILQDLRISYLNEPTCYTMDYASLMKAAENYNAFEKESGLSKEFVTISEADACYVLRYQIAIEGMPISSHENGSFGDGSWTSGTMAECIYSKDGLVGLSLAYQLEADGAENEGAQGLSLEEALELLDQKYNSMILEGSYLVDNIDLEYVPLPQKGSLAQCTVVPTWRFSVLHTYEVPDKVNAGLTQTVERRSNVVFHAISGEELITEASDV